MVPGKNFLVELLGGDNLLLVVNDGCASDDALLVLWIVAGNHSEAGVSLLLMSWKLRGKVSSSSSVKSSSTRFMSGGGESSKGW